MIPTDNMNTKTISNHALSVIDQYSNFNYGSATCSVPYFNNKIRKIRAGLRSLIGKGSPKDIYDEIASIIIKMHADANTLTNEQLKTILTDNNIGIDCSAFVYYVLNAESIERGLGQIDKKIKFINCTGLVGKIRCHMRPVENCDVRTFSSDLNSRIIGTKDVKVGDIITMVNSTDDNIRDHVLIIHEVTYQNYMPTVIKYSHAIAYADDGVYGTGIKKGLINITDNSKSISEQVWIEKNNDSVPNELELRAKKATTEIRRLKWFD